MKKVFVLLFAFVSLAAVSNAQTYQTGIGAKFYVGGGSLGGINIRHSSAENTALEGSLLFFNGGLGLEGLYEYQAPISGVEGLEYFGGGGALLGFGTGRSNNNNVAFSLRLTGGVDYKFAEAPFAVSFALDPFFNLAPETGANLTLGIGLRYILK